MTLHHSDDWDRRSPMQVQIGPRTRNQCELTARVTVRIVVGEGRVSAPGLTGTDTRP